jgi:DNA-binding HxlR family transcriptional regulator
MRRSQKQAHRSGCPIGIALDLIGDPWTLLIVRDLMFKGAKSFNDFLAAGEGIATNVLTDRLARLETNGIVTKGHDTQDARRFIYRLTEKGIDLAPVLVELVLWSTSYEKTAAPPEVVKAMQTDRIGFMTQVREAWKESQSKSRSTT